MAKAKGKRYLEAAKTVGTEKELLGSLEAIELVKKAATAKFDETVDVAVKLGVDPRHGDQMIRGVCNLPFGTGKVRKVAVITKDDGIAQAEAAGADFVGSEDLVKQIQGGWMDFDILLATPNVMNLVGRLGSILRAKMPSKKAGTVAENIGEVVKQIKSASRVEYRVEKAGIIHCPIGKASFDADKLNTNLLTLIAALVKAKPASAKGKYLIKVNISSTMGPSVELDTNELAKEAKKIK
ncbi:MAG: 50S ribosomal protein L1 [Armatimonadetes bacterium]|nr:50S ribosomal protein L1 [Candidatus Hippobium faecium]